MAFATKEKEREYNRRYYLENRETMLDKMHKWRDENKERHRAKMLEYHYKNRETILPKKRAQWKANADEINARRREKKFGLSAEAYATLFAFQRGCCAICGDQRKLVVDHCHKTGVVRALLCNPCNTALGLFKEDLNRMRAAIMYLAKTGALEAPQGLQ